MSEKRTSVQCVFSDFRLGGGQPDGRTGGGQMDARGMLLIFLMQAIIRIACEAAGRHKNAIALHVGADFAERQASRDVYVYETLEIEPGTKSGQGPPNMLFHG